MYNFYTFAAMMKSSAYVKSHSCFLLTSLLFLDAFVNFLHELLCFKISIYFPFTALDSNINYVKAQMCVLVPLHTLSAVLIFFRI